MIIKILRSGWVQKRCGVLGVLVCVSLAAVPVASADPPDPGNHECVVTNTGTVKCWGTNWMGNLGNDSTTDSLTPKLVSSLPSSAVQVTTGGDHSCARLANNSIACWGSNYYRQIGIAGSTGTTCEGLGGRISCAKRPFIVTGLPGVPTRVVAGQEHTCVLVVGGSVACWGRNRSGQLGTTATTGCSTPDRWGDFSCRPVSVKGLAGVVTQVAAGGGATCALIQSGSVQCWGDNSRGQLGTASTGKCGETKSPSACAKTPVTVTGLGSGVKSISMGPSHACAILTSEAIKCWGSNAFGQLGNTSSGACGGTDWWNACSKTPVVAQGLTGSFTQVIAGSGFTCALSSSGAVKCWGDNRFWQLGSTSTGKCGDPHYPQYLTSCSKTPITVQGSTAPFNRIHAGFAHTCASTSTGLVQCWGFIEGWPSGSTSKKAVTVAGLIVSSAGLAR